MARIAGVDLPRQKRVEIALTYIYGIGVTRSNKILAQAAIEPSVRVKDLSEEEVSRIARILDGEGGVEGDLRKETAMNINATGGTCPCGASGRTRTPARGRDRAGA